MLRRVLAVGWLMMALLGGGRFASAAERPALAPTGPSALHQKIAEAVARDVQVEPSGESLASRLQALDGLLSLPPAAELHVTSVHAGYSPGTWLLRIDCSWRSDCLPFHAILRSPTASLRGQSAAALPAQVANQPSELPGKPKPLRSPLARSGDHVLLVEERSGMRLQVPAVCLQSGGLGDEIRVQNLATRRVLLATVAGKNLVRVQ
jgi:hypothetical protein